MITARELVAGGLSRSAIDRWVNKELLHREFQGVYRLGHRAPSVEAHYMAAVLACGGGAALSGRAAAHHYGLLKGQPPPPEVTARWTHRVPGVRVRRRQVDVRIWRGLPTVTVPQVIVELAGQLHLDDLALAWEDDRRRDRRARARGDEYRRYTYSDVCKDPGDVLVEMRLLLGRGGER